MPFASSCGCNPQQPTCSPVVPQEHWPVLDAALLEIFYLPQQTLGHLCRCEWPPGQTRDVWISPKIHGQWQVIGRPGTESEVWRR